MACFNANNQVPNTTTCNDGVALEFVCKVVGAVGTMAECRIFFQFGANSPSTNTVIHFTGDLSDCHSTFVIRPWGNRAKDAGPSAFDALQPSGLLGPVRIK